MTTTKKIVALIACLALVLSCVGFCFADDLPYVQLPQVTTPPSSANLNSSGLLVFTSASYAYSCYFGASLAYNEPIFLGIVHEGNSDYLYLGSQEQGATAYFNNVAGNVQSRSCTNYSSLASGAYWVNSNVNLNSYSDRVMEVNLPTFNSAVEFGQYVASYTSFVGEVVTFSLEPGYAYVIEGVCEVSDRTYTLTGTSNLSALSNKNGSVQWFGSVGNIRDNFSPDLNNSSNIFNWTPLNPNPSGEASNYSYHAIDVVNVSSGSAFVVTYPLYYGSKYVPTGASAVVENSVNMTGSIYIQYTGDRPVMRRVALKSEQTFADNFVSYYNVFMPSVVNETVSYTVSDGTVVVDPSSAPSGGADAGSPSEDIDNTVLGVLQRFVNNITGLLSSGAHAIQELVTLGSSFMLSISAMFGWLPTGLTTLIITAFTIVLVIGVIKLLWK